jgi:4-oxalocrotonate tautomerase
MVARTYPSPPSEMEGYQKSKRNTKEEIQMPYVSIRVAGRLAKKQKEEICATVTEVISRVAKKPPESILIFIDEVEHENIATAGKLLVRPS